MTRNEYDFEFFAVLFSKFSLTVISSLGKSFNSKIMSPAKTLLAGYGLINLTSALKVGDSSGLSLLTKSTY